MSPASVRRPCFRLELSGTPDFNHVGCNLEYAIVWVVGALKDRLHPLLPEIVTCFARNIQPSLSLYLEVRAYLFRIGNATVKMDFRIMLNMLYLSGVLEGSDPDCQIVGCDDHDVPNLRFAVRRYHCQVCKLRFL